MTVTRQPAGIPIGGQFAASTSARADVALADVTSTGEHPADARRDFDARSIGEQIHYTGPIGYGYQKVKQSVDITGELRSYTPNGRGGVILGIANGGRVRQILVAHRDLTASRTKKD